MRALIFSDIQAHEGSERLRADSSVSLQLWRVRRLYSRLTEIAQANKCDAIWDLGDTLDDRNVISLKTLNTVDDGLTSLCQGTQPVTNFKLIGNHEQHLKNTRVHAGPAFRPFFNVIEDRSVLFLPDGSVVVAVAFPADENELAAWIKSTLERLSNHPGKVILIGHFQVNSGLSATGLTADALDHADVALLGHVHKPQQLGKNTHYIGSPFQQDFGESDEKKRALVLDTTTVELSWIPLENFPIYLNVSFSDFTRWRHPHELNEDRLRVALQTPAETAEFYRHPLANLVEPLYAYHSQARVQERAVVSQITDPLTMLETYVKDRPLAGFTQDELIAAGKLLMNLR